MTQIDVTALATNTLLHAEPGAGERNTVFILATLTDESGEVLTDQLGEVLTAYGETPVIILHTQATSSLIHSEDL